MYGNTKLALLPILCVCENLESSFFETDKVGIIGTFV